MDVISRPPQRKLSFTLMLNDDYEGGEFEIGRYSFGEWQLKTETTVAENKTGTLVVFPSTLPHRVKPVSKGIRKSLVGWVPGPPLR
jgi:PKHD-type hydroxylase